MVLDRMTQKKLMLRNEMSQIINIITEDNDSIVQLVMRAISGCGAASCGIFNCNNNGS